MLDRNTSRSVSNFSDRVGGARSTLAHVHGIGFRGARARARARLAVCASRRFLANGAF